MTTLKPMEQAAVCLCKAAELRLREFDAGWPCYGLSLRLLFQHAADKARAAGYPSLASRIEAAKAQPGQPECDLIAAVRARISARALPVGRAA